MRDSLARALWLGLASLTMVVRASSATPPVQRGVSIRADTVSEHRLTAPAVIHEEMPDGFTSLEIFLHVVVNSAGQVESAKVWNMDRPDVRWAIDQAEAAERAQRFRPFKHHRRLTMATFDDVVWIVPPVEWASAHVSFPEIVDWKTLRIRLERTACYGMCPVYRIEVQGDGTVWFEGESNVPAPGRSRGTVSREVITRLVAAFRKVDYFSLKSEYAAMITDNPSCITSLSFDNVTKSVKDYVGTAAGMPEDVVRLESAIDQIARDKGWIR